MFGYKRVVKWEIALHSVLYTSTKVPTGRWGTCILEPKPCARASYDSIPASYPCCSSFASLPCRQGAGSIPKLDGEGGGAT